jgi:predicted cupin superfamily sugar epimerase
MHPRAAELMDRLGLQAHPEGGYYREVFRSESVVEPSDRRGARTALTTIYFLLTRGTWSRWHRVRSDEVWHLYEGGPVELFDVDLDARALTRHCLDVVADGERAPVYTIAAGHWQAARAAGEYALAGCTVGPGFEFADFELLANDSRRARTLNEAWPELASML